MAYFDLSRLYPLNPLERYLREVFLTLRQEMPPDELIKSASEIQALAKACCETSNSADLVKAWRETFSTVDLANVRLRTGQSFFSLFETTIEKYFFRPGYDVSIRRHDRYFPIGFHNHDFYEVVCVLDGACAHLIGTDRGILRRGDVAFIPPGTKHSIAVYNNDCVLYNLGFRLSTFEQKFKELFSNRHILTDFLLKTMKEQSVNSYIVFHTGNYLLGDNYLAEIEREYDGKQAYSMDRLNALTHLFLIELMRNYAVDAIVSLDNHSGAKIDDIILNYVQNHFRAVTLAELGILFHYSERQLSRIIKNSTGLSFSAYVGKLRHHYAAAMLEKTDLSVARIIELSGDTNPTHFYRAFRDEYGMTPAEYRGSSRQRST